MALKEVCDRLKSNLANSIDAAQKKRKQRIDEFIDNKKPQYRLMRNKRPEMYDNVSTANERSMEMDLFKELQKWELETAEKCVDISSKEATESEDIALQQRISEYMEGVSDLSRVNLAGYVSKRKAVLDLLQQAMRNNSGKYSLENVIHKLVCPMELTSDDVNYTDMNLWIIDEKLAYHYYLASDIALNKHKTVKVS